MINRLVRFFVVFFTTGILFTGCPIEYTPFVDAEPPFVPPEGTVTVTGEAEGFGVYAIGSAHVVRVTLYFSPDAVFLNVATDTRYESSGPGYEDIDAAIANWRNRVQQGGIVAIPVELPLFQLHLWPSNYVSAFAGATISVNALTRAARKALNQLPPGFLD